MTPTELIRLQKSDPGLGNLRVHPSKKLWVIFSENAKADSIDVTKARVTIRNDRYTDDKVFKRRLAGSIIGFATLSKMPLLWVTWDDECEDPSCAYGFVLTEYDRYSLVILPKREGFDDPIAYRRTRTRRTGRNRLRLSKLRSLAELNDVLAVSRRRGKRALSIDLQFTKKTRKRNKHNVIRVKGTS